MVCIDQIRYTVAKIMILYVMVKFRKKITYMGILNGARTSSNFQDKNTYT
jgi:hypothetical protein